MKKLVLIIIALITSTSFVYAQKSSKNPVDFGIQKLIDLKVDYEKYKGVNGKGDSILRLYEGQINKMKNSKDIYLRYIKLASRENKAQLTMESVPYKYLTVTESNISLRRHLIKKIDLYKVIRYSLFKKNDSILPQDFRGLPVVDEKNYNGYDKNKKSEYRIAAKFLLNNLSFTHQEKKFIKNSDNQVYVLDIKKYVDTNGLNSKNNEFIKWAINFLKKYPGVSIAYLNNSYEPIRSKDYVPKDKRF